MHRFSPLLAVAGVLGAWAFVVSGPAGAMTTTCGSLVCFQYDETQDALDYFGAPSLVGNDLIFTPGLPNQFRAESIDGIGIHTGTNTDTLSKTLVIDRVYSIDPGNEIVGIAAYEQGDYRITTDGTVSADLYLQAASLVYVLDNSLSTDSVGASGDSGGLQLWQMMAMVNPAADFSQAANNLKLTVQNDLSAFTDAAGERAWIEKKLVLAVTTVVPVPAAVWLFGSALGLLGWIRRR